MVGERARMLVKKAKPVPKFIPEVPPKSRSSSPPSLTPPPPCSPEAPRKGSTLPTLLLSTLHKKGKDSSHSSSDKESSTHGSNISGIEQFADIDDFDKGEENTQCDILNTAHTESQVFSHVEDVEMNATIFTNC